MIVQKNLYSDIPMFISPNPFTGDMSLKKDQNAIQESVKNTILTAVGERPFELTFGTNVYNALFENPQLAQFYVESSVSPVLNDVEPRIRITKFTYDNTEKQLNINIEYLILSIEVLDNVRITLQRTR
jgi:phage baseplate assembly protein W